MRKSQPQSFTKYDIWNEQKIGLEALALFSYKEDKKVSRFIYAFLEEVETRELKQYSRLNEKESSEFAQRIQERMESEEGCLDEMRITYRNNLI